VKGFPVIGPERFVAYGTAVVHGRYGGGTLQAESNHIVCIRHRITLLIQNFYRYKSQVFAPCLQDNPVRGQFKAGRLSCRGYTPA